MPSSREPISDAEISDDFGALIWAAQQAFRSDASYLAEMIESASRIEFLRDKWQGDSHSRLTTPEQFAERREHLLKLLDEGASLEEAATVLGVAVSTARSIRGQARKMQRERDAGVPIPRA